ncbi:MAG: protein kinase [Planctomycetales bacterium]|nr:protein kinase [Planctomycetales bacterium]
MHDHVARSIPGSKRGHDLFVRERRHINRCPAHRHSDVHIYEAVQHEGRLHLVMEFLDGQTLADLTDGHPLPPDEALKVVSVLARALAVVHEAGVLHRDLKPANIMVTESGVPKITDFGLARLESHEQFLTTREALIGTPCYMAPEQAAGQAETLGPTCDVYAVGAILYELLTGRPPLLGATLLDTLAQIRDRDPIAPRKLIPGIPLDVDTICMKCLEKNPSNRYAAAGALAEDLDRFLSGRPIVARAVPRREKVWRWCRRNPVITGLSLTLMCVVALGLTGVLWKWREAEVARRDENQARREATARANELREAQLRQQQASEFMEKGQVLVDWRRWDDAEYAFTRALQLRPLYAPAWQARGNLYLQLGLWDLAQLDLRKTCELRPPKLPDEYWALALVCVEVGDTQSYQQVRDQVTELYQGCDLCPINQTVIRTACLSPGDEPKFEPLAELAKSITEVQPQDPLSHSLLAWTHYRAGHYNEVLNTYQSGRQPAEGSTGATLDHLIMSMACYQLGERERAHEHLEQASRAIDRWLEDVTIQDTHLWVVHLGATGSWPVSMNQSLECTVLHREATRLLGGQENQADARLFILRARALSGLRRHSLADSAYDSALALRPADVEIQLEAFRNRGYLFASRQQFDEAAEAFEAARQLRTKDADLWRFRAISLHAARRVEAYRQACREMVECFRSTDDPAVAHDVIETCVTSADALENVAELLPFAELAGRWYLGAERMSGAAYVRAGDYDTAIACFQRAASVHNLRPWDFAFYAMAEFQTGNRPLALELLDEARRWVERADSQRIPDVAGILPAWGDWNERRISLALLAEARDLINPCVARNRN